MKILYDIENNYKNINFDAVSKVKIDDQFVSILVVDTERIRLFDDTKYFKTY